MRLPSLIAIGSFLVLQVDHADRLIAVKSAASAALAERVASTQAPDLPAAVVVRVENQARGQGQFARVPEPLIVPLDRLAPDVGVVIGAASDGSVVSIRPTADLQTAYELERLRLSPSIPRAVLGVVHARLLPSARARLTRRRR